MRIRLRSSSLLIDVWLLAVLAAYVTHRIIGASVLQSLYHAVRR